MVFTIQLKVATNIRMISGDLYGHHVRYALLQSLLDALRNVHVGILRGSAQYPIQVSHSLHTLVRNRIPSARTAERRNTFD